MAANKFYDEMAGYSGVIRQAYRPYHDWLERMPTDLLPTKSRQADLMFRRMGITFAVYGDESGTERLIPFDVVPRILSAKEWQKIQDGCIQRVKALNAFLHDVYHQREIIKAGIVPADMVLRNPFFRTEMINFDVPGGIYIHVAGVDIVRDSEDVFYVLEDNLRSPSGVSYMMENRTIMMRLFPQLFANQRIAPVLHYPMELLRALQGCSPFQMSEPTVALLTPGIYNSAYFEHAFLADEMGIELVEGRDLFVMDGYCYMRTASGPKRVDVIYRRIDDEFLDPLAFDPNGLLGVPGLLSVYRSGKLTLANAIGTGVADDKAIYVLVPEMIKFYLGEEPILSNVPTWQLRKPDDCAYVLEHLHELVVKEVHGAGGYGMLVGPHATKDERSQFAQLIRKNPANYIAQPTLKLSTCPTLTGDGLAARHVDLRPYVLSTPQSVTVVPGGLTRVALREGSLVVNSSQGGGTKDTWVLED